METTRRESEMQTVNNKWSGEKAEVRSTWITERADLSFVTVWTNDEIQEEWRLEDIQGGMESFWQYGVECIEHLDEFQPNQAQQAFLPTYER